MEEMQNQNNFNGIDQTQCHSERITSENTALPMTGSNNLSELIEKLTNQSDHVDDLENCLGLKSSDPKDEQKQPELDKPILLDPEIKQEVEDNQDNENDQNPLEPDSNDSALDNEIYNNFLQNVAIDISENGWHSSKAPSPIKYWLAAEVVSSLPQKMVADIFKVYLEGKVDADDLGEEDVNGSDNDNVEDLKKINQNDKITDELQSKDKEELSNLSNHLPIKKDQSTIQEVLQNMLNTPSQQDNANLSHQSLSMASGSSLLNSPLLGNRPQAAKLLPTGQDHALIPNVQPQSSSFMNMVNQLMNNPDWLKNQQNKCVNQEQKKVSSTSYFGLSNGFNQTLPMPSPIQKNIATPTSSLTPNSRNASTPSNSSIMTSLAQKSGYLNTSRFLNLDEKVLESINVNNIIDHQNDYLVLLDEDEITHKKEYMIKCLRCKKYTTRQYERAKAMKNFRNHLQRSCIRDTKCPICLVQITKQKFEKHLYVKHHIRIKEETHTCIGCGRDFLSQRSLRLHQLQSPQCKIYSLPKTLLNQQNALLKQNAAASRAAQKQQAKTHQGQAAMPIINNNPQMPIKATNKPLVPAACAPAPIIPTVSQTNALSDLLTNQLNSAVTSLLNQTGMQANPLNLGRAVPTLNPPTPSLTQLNQSLSILNSIGPGQNTCKTNFANLPQMFGPKRSSDVSGLENGPESKLPKLSD